tara:strand:- start:3347 stop:4255 length:909 start_codon:yes stop_codon:yes gene_type:complete
MPYQVTMDRTLSDTDFDRLVQANYGRRKYNTRFETETDEEYKAGVKESIDHYCENFEGRWRMVRWIPYQTEEEYGDPTKVFTGKINSEDPLGLEAHPTENDYPIIGASYCYAVNHENNTFDGYMPTTPTNWKDELTEDWIAAGNTGSWETNFGLQTFGLWAAPEQEPTIGPRTQLLNWCYDAHVKGSTPSPKNKISLMPMVEYYQSIGVTHWGHFIKGSKQKQWTKDLLTGTTVNMTAEEQAVNNFVQKVNGNLRGTHPHDFPYKWAYHVGAENDVDNDTLCLVLMTLACEDKSNGIGWPSS